MITTTYLYNGIWRAQASKPSEYDGYCDRYTRVGYGRSPEAAIINLLNTIANDSTTKPFEVNRKPFILECMFDSWDGRWISRVFLTDSIETFYTGAGWTAEKAITALLRTLSDEYIWINHGLGETWVEDDNFGIY